MKFENYVRNDNKYLLGVSNSKMIHEFIEEQSAKTPNTEAVKFKNTSISYQELNERSNQIAYYLREQGIKSDELVLISMNRSIEVVIGLLAILKAGGAYIPIDPNYPNERIKYIAADANAKILIVDRNIELKFSHVNVKALYIDEQQLFASYSKTNLANINIASDLCYVIYTSGSTGNPKGVANIHRGVVNRILWMHEQYKLTTADKVLQKTPFGFDVSVWEFFWPMMTGATLVMAAPEIHKDAYELANLIEAEKITTIHFVPSMLNLFLDADVAHKCSSLKRIFASGEALSYSLQNKFFKQFSCEFYNLYGPTEVSIDVTHWKCIPNEELKIVPIGYPIANTYLYILDDNLQPVNQGETGELFIGGIGLARGYIHNESLTKEKFIVDPFFPNKKIYRTGDLCRFLDNGAIEYIGRIDNQIKLRGLRIEIGEIEHIIRKNLLIKNIAVIAREDIVDQKYLAAYLITYQQSIELKQEIIASLKSSLPEYMVPSVFIFLDDFPLNPNGKLDIKQLPKPSKQDQFIDYACVLPRNANEQALQRVWCDVLDFDSIGVTVPFFYIGGHSLQAMLLVLKIRQQLGKIISLSEIFNYATIEQQAKLIEYRPQITERLKQITPDIENSLTPFPLTDIQTAYFLGRSSAFMLGGIRSHIYIENEIKDLNISRLEESLNLIISRHSMLRVVLLDNGTQQITKDEKKYSIVLNTGNLIDIRENLITRFKANKNNILFEISVTPLGDKKFIVHFYFDLIVADGTGLEVFFNELSMAYMGLQLNPAPKISYRDALLALSQQNEQIVDSKEYWFNRVDNLPDAPKLPLSNLQKDIQYPFIRRKFSLSSERWQQFQQVAAKLSITPAALLMTAYGQTIKTWSDSSHFTLNLMFFNRPPIHSDINNIIGNFSTTLLLEMNMHDVLTFAERAKLVQKQLISDLEHSEFNGIKVLNEINRRKGGSSLAAMPVVFACALNLRPIDSSQKNFFKWYGNQVSYSHLETPQVWLDHQVFEDDDGSLCCIWDARDGYFPDGLINTMFESYEKLLHTISIGAININNLSIIPDEDLNLIHLINDTKAERSKELLHFGIIQYAIRTPNKVAIITQDLSITYQQLIATAGEIKQDLINLGVRHNDLVSIVMEKGWEQIASAIAILSAGAVYIPIDASLPESRIKQIELTH